MNAMMERMRKKGFEVVELKTAEAGEGVFAERYSGRSGHGSQRIGIGTADRYSALL